VVRVWVSIRVYFGVRIVFFYVIKTEILFRSILSSNYRSFMINILNSQNEETVFKVYRIYNINIIGDLLWMA
jgi:hypothetical protein